MLLTCGLVTLDVQQTVDRLPGPDEKVVARGLTTAFGGPAANAAATAVALGVPARLVTVVGEGPLADVVRAGLAGAGVALTEVTTSRPARPPVSTVLVTAATGQRAVVSTNAGGVDVVPLDEAGLDALLLGAGEGDVLLLDGHLPGVAVPLARRARSRGCRVVLDAGSWKPGSAELLATTDVVVASADLRVPGVPAAGTLAALAAAGPRFAAVSRGALPVLVLDDGAPREVPVPAPARVADTLGAGDVLHGALAAALAQGATPAEALASAVRVATRSVEHAGALGWTRTPAGRGEGAGATLSGPPPSGL